MPIISFIPKKVPIKDNRNPNGNYYTATCDQCGKEYYPKRSNARYCSAECSRKHWQVENKDKIKASKPRVNNNILFTGSGKAVKDFLKIEYHISKSSLKELTKTEIGDKFTMYGFEIERITTNKYNVYSV
jgi:hypothetical protein